MYEDLSYNKQCTELRDSAKDVRMKTYGQYKRQYNCFFDDVQLFSTDRSVCHFIVKTNIFHLYPVRVLDRSVCHFIVKTKIFHLYPVRVLDRSVCHFIVKTKIFHLYPVRVLDRSVCHFIVKTKLFHLYPVRVLVRRIKLSCKITALLLIISNFVSEKANSRRGYVPVGRIPTRSYSH